MNIRKNVFRAASYGVALLALTISANAQYSGQGWFVNNFQAQNATPLQIAFLGAAQFTFNASAVDFSSFGNISNTGNGSADYTVISFLNSLGSASSINSVSGPPLSSPMDHANGGVMLKITGTAFFTNGQSFTVAHDDGLTITVGGSTILSDGGPTSPVTTPYTYSGPTGNQSFEIDYGECCGAPAVLETTLVPARVPEPASIFLLGTLLCGVGTMVRRKFSNMS